MKNRIPKYNCPHYNITPIWYINGQMYIFWCRDCDTFILKFI